MKKGLLIYLFLPSLILSQELKDFSNDSIEDLKWGYENYMPTSTCGEMIHYSNYSVSFCEEYRLSEWAIYYMTANDIIGPGFSIRGFNFKRDPKLNGRDAENGAFYKNIYDKGHLVPYADMNSSLLKLSETYFFTNVTPQHADLNRGGWRELEKLVRDWTIKFDKVAIISGWVVGDIKCYLSVDGRVVFFDNNPGHPYIPVPNNYYKVFIDIQSKRSIAFIFPNKKITKPIMEYVVSIDYLESVTGLDFFYKLSDEDELSFEIDTGNKK
jgi:endonuclease G